MDKILDNFDLSKANVILCEKAKVAYEVITKIENETEDTIVHELQFLPSPVMHHSTFEQDFKGILIESDRPIIFTQSKEFLECILNIKEDVMNVISSDFNVVQITEKDGELVFITHSKEEAYHLMIEEGIDLRDIED